MQAACPIDRDLALFPVQSCSALHAATRTDTTELEQAVEDWTVVSDVVFALLFAVVLHIVGSDLLEEIHIVVGMELGHLVLCRRFGTLEF